MLEAATHEEIRTEGIKPIEREGLKRLVERRPNLKKVACIQGSDLSNRDVIEYGYLRNMSYLLQQASGTLMELWLSRGFTRETADGLFSLLIETAGEKGWLGREQGERLVLAKDRLLDDIEHFSEWLKIHGEEDIRGLLGTRFDGIDRSKYKVDSERFPGVVVIEAGDTETYKKIVGQDFAAGSGNKGSVGAYGLSFGEGEMRGRILVIDVTMARVKTPEHEYRHFLFGKLAKDLEITPEVGKRLMRKSLEGRLRQKREIERRLERPSSRREDVVGRALLEIEMERLKPSASFAAGAELATYPNGPIEVAFRGFRNEFLSLAAEGIWPKRVDVYFGNRLDAAKKDANWNYFRQEVILMKNMLEEARKRGIEPADLAFLVAGSRSMQQAAKNVYLELQARGERL